MRTCTSGRVRRVASIALFILAITATTVLAQSAVRVTADHVSVWNPGFTTVATTVNTGTVLEVVRRQGNWYEVVLTGPEWQGRATGFIAVSRVEPVNGERIPGQDTAGRVTQGRSGRTPANTSHTTVADWTWRVFGEAGFGRFSAAQTFDAVLGSSNGAWFGGGATYRWRQGLFVQGSVEHFQKTGERVFVSDGTVYKLGIEDKVSVTPIMAVAGYRARAGAVAVYGGGGAGAYLLRETSAFADAADNVKQTHAAYRGLAGIEIPLARSVGAAVEVQYTAVPNALTGGTADTFDEHDLGGIAFKVKLLFGR